MWKYYTNSLKNVEYAHKYKIWHEFFFILEYKHIIDKRGCYKTFMENVIVQLLILLLLVLINAFFAMSEIALITINDNKINILAKIL